MAELIGRIGDDRPSAIDIGRHHRPRHPARSPSLPAGGAVGGRSSRSLARLQIMLDRSDRVVAQAKLADSLQDRSAAAINRPVVQAVVIGVAMRLIKEFADQKGQEYPTFLDQLKQTFSKRGDFERWYKQFATNRELKDALEVKWSQISAAPVGEQPAPVVVSPAEAARRELAAELPRTSRDLMYFRQAAAIDDYEAYAAARYGEERGPLLYRPLAALGPHYPWLLTDPGLMAPNYFDQFLAFVDRYRAAGRGPDNPWSVMQDFKTEMGSRKVVRALMLTPQDAAAIRRTGMLPAVTRAVVAAQQDPETAEMPSTQELGPRPIGEAIESRLLPSVRRRNAGGYPAFTGPGPEVRRKNKAWEDWVASEALTQSVSSDKGVAAGIVKEMVGDVPGAEMYMAEMQLPNVDLVDPIDYLGAGHSAIPRAFSVTYEGREPELHETNRGDESIIFGSISAMEITSLAPYRAEVPRVELRDDEVLKLTGYDKARSTKN